MFDARTMFQKSNRLFHLTKSQLHDIIKNLEIHNSQERQIAESCYALCNYWTNNDKGAIEFLHNNVRDFFLCEHIMDEMNRLYQEIPSLEVDQHILILERLFQYAELPQATVEFLYLRTKYNLDNKSEDIVARIELSTWRLPHIYQNLLTKGPIKQPLREEELHPYEAMCNTFSGTIQLYRHIYEPYLSYEKDGQLCCRLISWWVDVNAIQRTSVLRDLFKRIFVKVPVNDINGNLIATAGYASFRGLNLSHADLRYATFRYSDLRYADFSESIACGADFSGADLSNTDFTNADLSYASFENAKLTRASFSGVRMCSTTLPNGSISSNPDDLALYLK